MIRHVVTLATLTLATALFASCHLAVGVDDYKSLAKEACACEDTQLLFSDCEARVESQLAGTTDKGREFWLAIFEANDCDVCENQLACLQQEPVCRAEGDDCELPFDCCGTVEGLSYCHEGRCVAEAPNCRKTFEKCMSDADCCGSEGDLATCIDVDGSDAKLCLERCSPSYQVNCPGCCAATSSPVFGDLEICLGGSPVMDNFPAGKASCDAACISGVDESGCAPGTACQTVESEGSTIDFCL